MRLRLLIAILTLAAGLAAQTCMPAFWHTYEELVDAMFAWEQQYPDICKVDSIGVTNGAAYQEPITIWGMKVSDNVEVDEDEPPLLFVGSCHAEEVIGNEAVYYYMQRLLECQAQWPYSQFISDLEIWFVPTINPEGIHVVMYEGDVSFRKTKRDNNENGVFDFDPSIGNDIDGVDPNRNYDFGWVHGDTLYSTNGEEEFDYYRGPAPFSEGGTTAIAALGRREHFVYSINFHSSRTGNFSEKVFFPWEFYQLPSRRCPDFDISQHIGMNVAGCIPKVGSAGNYEYSPSSGRIGKSTPWFYAALGTFQLTIEVSSNQPDSTLMFEIVLNNHQGMNWLLKRTLNGVLDISPMLRGRVVDATNGEPLVAEVILEERVSPYFEPRLTDEPHGRFWRPVPQGTYTLTIRKPGYVTHTQSVVVNPSGWSQDYLIELQPLSAAHYTGSLTDSAGTSINGTLVLSGEHGSESFEVTAGQIDFTLWEGDYTIEAWCDGYTRLQQPLAVTPGNHELDISLDPATVIFGENFDDAYVCGFTLDGPWQFIDELAMEGTAITDSWGGYGFYAQYCDVNITTTELVNIPAGLAHASIEWWEHVYTEPDWDMCTLCVSTDGQNWTTIYEVSGKHDTWNRRLVSLDDYIGQSLYLRFRLTDDSPDERLVDPGWTIDNLLVSGGDAVLSAAPDDPGQPAYTRLNGNYPNPFNPETTFRFSLGAEAHEAELRVYNVRGALVDVLPLGETERRSGEVRWNAAGQASGVYLYRLRVNGVDYPARKACLLK
ncbi:MAG: carboxypeptidase regulatory-like domain-containing protein [Candidatus Cloacimonetes bacterium]|nr:carboxypeptidase regulatory-like domain-containing protein [Candidatus Cloacimonadota bacterium]